MDLQNQFCIIIYISSKLIFFHSLFHLLQVNSLISKCQTAPDNFIKFNLICRKARSKGTQLYLNFKY